MAWNTSGKGWGHQTDMWVDMDIDMDIVFGTAVCECAVQGHGYVRVFSLSVMRT